MYSDLEGWNYYQNIIPWAHNFSRKYMRCIMPQELKSTLLNYWKFYECYVPKLKRKCKKYQDFF